VSQQGINVGVIGLGNMGAPIARHLAAAGFVVHGYDVRPAARDGLRDDGGIPAGSCAEVAAAAEVVLTSLPTAAALDAVIDGPDGLLAGAKPDLLVLETSTFAVATKERVREILQRHGAAMLDCPISGTASQLADRDVAVYASGDPDLIASVRPVLAAFSRTQYDVGSFGNGTKLKLIANHLVTVHNAAAAEALLLAESAGLDLALALQVLTDGAGTSRMLEVRGPMMLAKDFTKANMRLDGYQKDIDLIGAFARDVHCPLPLFAASAQLYLAALAQGRGAEDPAVIAAVLEGMRQRYPSLPKRSEAAVEPE
jgi:3-hydroxyisobutyrate dehydrogenase-like beta-hydroxyacid dehydrogenase